MSAMEANCVASLPVTSQTRIRLVSEEELSAVQRRRAYAHRQARLRSVALAQVWLLRGAVTTVFAGAASTMVWAFLSVPNLPLP